MRRLWSSRSVETTMGNMPWLWVCAQQNSMPVKLEVSEHFRRHLRTTDLTASGELQARSLELRLRRKPGDEMEFGRLGETNRSTIEKT